MSFRVFVTATDTGVGKTEVSCALLSLLAERGLRPAAFKPYESGVSARTGPSDALRLREAAGSIDPLNRIVLHTFKEPLAPGIAARQEGRNPSFAKVLRAFESFADRPLVMEGAGGLFVPLDVQRDVIDLIETVKLPVLLVARAGLGTLNHVALSLAALEARSIPVLSVVLVKSNPEKDVSERDNARWIKKRHRVRVLGPVPFVKNEGRRREAFRSVLAPLLSR